MTALTASDGVRLEYGETGDPRGRPVLLLAGFKAAATSWRYQLPALEKAGFRVIAADLRGHGAAERPAKVDMARRGLDVRDIIDGLDLRDVALVGGSMGGNTVWSYLRQCGADRVGVIVIVDQTPKMLGSADWPYGFYGYDETNRDTYFAESIPDTGKGTPLPRRGVRLVRLLRAMGGGERELMPGELALLHDHATADWRPDIAATAVPTLFVAGADSEFWPSGHAVAAAEIAPHGAAVVLADDGHAANIEQPKAFNRALLRFLG